MNHKTAKSLAHKNYLLAQICTAFRPAGEQYQCCRYQLRAFMLTRENGKYIIKLSNETHTRNMRKWSTLKIANNRGKFIPLELNENEIHEFLPLLNTTICLGLGDILYSETNALRIKFRAFLFDIIVKNSHAGIYTRKLHYFENDFIYPITTKYELNPDFWVKYESDLEAVLMAA